MDLLRASVIVPIYNQAAYLRQTLLSVFAQTRAPYEVIVIDDGSIDGSAEIACAAEPKVRYYWQDHLGVSAARNQGLAVAQGDVVAWIDGDDLWEPEFLETTLARLEVSPAIDGIYTGFAHIDGAGNVLSQVDNKVVPPSELFSTLIDANFIQTSAIVIRKKCFDQIGGFDRQFGISEDYDMWLRLARVFNIAGIPTPLVQYRVHARGTASNTPAFVQFRLGVIAKHFGPLEGDPATWSDEKQRAYAMTCRVIALRYMQDGKIDQGWQYLQKAALAYPAVLKRLDTYYEIACSDLPRGDRSDASSLDLNTVSTRMLGRLEQLLAADNAALAGVRQAAYGEAYLALGVLSDQAGHWKAARRYLLQAMAADPRLLLSYSVDRRFVKLCAGRRLIKSIQKLRDRRRTPAVNRLSQGLWRG